MRKVLVVVTARPSYSRIKSALFAIKDHPHLELQLVVAASALLDRYGQVKNELEQDGFRLNAQVFMVLEGENPTIMAKTTGLGLVELSTVFYNLKPDVVVTIADRYETLATAVAASYMNIPLAHVQGGEVTGSIDEKVRHAITKLSDIHFVSSENAAKRVIRMGEDPKSVFVTGCPSIDIAKEMLLDINSDFDPLLKFTGVGAHFDYSKGYIVVLQHPVTTEYELSLTHVSETLRAVDDIGLPTFWFWPNVDAGSDGTSKGIRLYRERNPNKSIHFFKNIPPMSFLRLINRSQCIIGNSSVGIRESAFLGIPSVNIGSRQNGRERGKNVIDVGYSKNEIKNAILKQISHGHYQSETIYGDGDAGNKIASLLADKPLTVAKRLSY